MSGLPTEGLHWVAKCVSRKANLQPFSCHYWCCHDAWNGYNSIHRMVHKRPGASISRHCRHILHSCCEKAPKSMGSKDPYKRKWGTANCNESSEIMSASSSQTKLRFYTLQKMNPRNLLEVQVTRIQYTNFKSKLRASPTKVSLS